MTDHDPYTGVLSRNAFNKHLMAAIEKATTNNSDFSLLYIDIDNMKHFNLHNGHLVGDQLLNNFVELVEPLLQKQGLLFRVGGDEFAVLLHNVGKEESLRLSQQICDITREKVAPHQPIHCGDSHCMGPAKISASIGIARFEHNMSMESFLEKAENKMYEAKIAGRDRVSA